MEFLGRLEEIKKMGNYSLSLHYGEGMGCDDSDVPIFARSIKIIFSPVGCLGEVRIMYKGTVGKAMSFNFKTKPTKISNPPTNKEYEADGYYIWGTERSVDTILEKPYHGGWI